MTTMPFGRYRGTPLGQVPPPYLTWVLNTVDTSRYPGLEPAIRVVLGMAGSDYGADPMGRSSGRSGEVKPVAIPWVKQRVDKCYREAALKYHPDRRGGSTEAMVAVNDCFERLRGSLELE